MKALPSLNRIKAFLSAPGTILLYGLVVLCYQAAYCIVPLRAIIGLSFLHWVSPALAVGGTGLLLLNVMVNPRRLLSRQMLIPWLLMLALCLSTAFNLDRGLTDNIKLILWQGNLMLLLFSACLAWGERDTVQSLPKAAHWLLVGLALLWDGAILWSLALFFARRYHQVQSVGGVFRQGLFEGRLFGIFTTPYSAALLSFIFALVWSFLAVKHRGCKRLFWWCSAGLAVTMLVLTGTRTVFLGGALSLFILLWMSLRDKQSFTLQGRSLRVPGALAPLLALAAVGCLVLLLWAYTLGLKALAAQSPAAPAQTAQGQGDLERPDTHSGDMSNNRFGIWRDYAQVFFDHPEKMLLGYSPQGYMPFIDENYPDLFIVGYFKGKFAYDYENLHTIYAPHNALIAVIMSTGLLGLALVLSLAIRLLVRVLRRYARVGLAPEEYVLFGVLLTMAVALMLESDVFFVCNSSSVVFWTSLGLLLGRCKDGKTV